MGSTGYLPILSKLTKLIRTIVHESEGRKRRERRRVEDSELKTVNGSGPTSLREQK